MTGERPRGDPNRVPGRVGRVKGLLLSLRDAAIRSVQPARKRFVVTGTGRCGTGYMAELITAAGLPCGHEEVFTPAGERWRAKPGDSSWLAAPHLDRFDGYVVHLVRNPLQVVGSMVGIGFLDPDRDDHRPWRAFADRHVDLDLNGPGDRVTLACDFVVAWNALIEPHADTRLQVEQVTGDDLVPLFDAVGMPRTATEIEEAVSAVPSTVNTRRRERLGWEDTTEELRELAVRYGYEV